MLEFCIQCEVPLPPSVLWRLRGTRFFMSQLVAHGALARMTATPARSLPDPATTASDGEPSASADDAAEWTPTLRERSFLYVPANIVIPEVVKTVFSDSYLEVRDRCVWDDAGRVDDLGRPFPIVCGAVMGRPVAATFEQRFTVTPGVLSDVIATHGVLRVEPAEGGDGTACTHTLEGRCVVSIFLLGGYVEEAIVDNMRAFYDAYPTHVARLRDALVARLRGEQEREGGGAAATLEELVAAADLVVAEERTEDKKKEEEEEEMASKEAKEGANGRLDVDGLAVEAVTPCGSTHM